MPTTSNFGWTTPADTDLVKDGAAAIRTLGNGIDTSLVDLKGGTTGQILSKASNADLDYTWINNDQGDITEVAAGTGISGGGTSGSVTITNSMATAIDAKGDLIVGTADNAFSRLASSGVNNQVLTVDTATATGLKWAAASSGGMTQLASGSLSGSSLALTNISGDYQNLQLQIFDLSVDSTSSATMSFTFMGLTADYRHSAYGHHTTSTAYNNGNLSSANVPMPSVDNMDTDANNCLIFNFYNYAASTRKIGDMRGYINYRFSQPTIFNMVFGNTGASAQAAMTSFTLTTTVTFDGGTYKLWGIK